MSIRVSIVTSDRSASLKRVAQDIGSVIKRYTGLRIRNVFRPDLSPRLYEDSPSVIIVMTFDTALAVPYFYLAWELQKMGKYVMFYTTIEGRIERYPWDEWIYRDLRFIANSRYTYDKLDEAGAKVDDIIYHGVNVDAIQSAEWMSQDIRNKIGLSGNEFVVGYIAGCYMRKGHDLYAKVLKEVEKKDNKIWALILTSKECADKYEDVNNAIILTDFGQMDTLTVYALYHVFDVYAQASLGEGFGLPVIESLAAGRLVVHADYNPLSEITTPETSVRVPVISVDYKREMGSIIYELHYYNPEQFADAIIHAKNRVSLNRDSIKKMCIDRAREFDIHKVYKPFVDRILEKVKSIVSTEQQQSA